MFKRQKTEVENESNLKFKCLRSNNDHEYDRANYKTYCIVHGVKLVLAVPNRPLQNGIVARMNQTLNKLIRVMPL